MVKREIAEVREIAVHEALTLGRGTCQCVLAGERGHFAAVAAKGHGTPTAAVRARIVVEEKTAMQIGTQPETRVRSFGDNLGAGAGNSSEQPVQAPFPRHELDFPGAVLADQLIVPLGNTQNLVNGLDPFASHSLLSEHGAEGLAQRNVEAPGLQEKSFGSLWVDLGKTEKLDASLGSNNVRRVQELDKPLPGKLGV
jgi:hypothetical protein